MSEKRMEMGFQFRESDHRYFYDGRPMTGVTTVLGMIAKPALIGWAAKMAVEYSKKEIGDMFEKYDGVVPFEYIEEVLDKSKTAYAQKRDTAAVAGTDVHKEIEEIIKHTIEGHDLRLNHDNKQVTHFIEWVTKNKVKFLESEKKVYSLEHFVGGTMDFKCVIDNKVYVGDIKTSSAIYDRTPFAQIAAYQMMEEEIAGGRVLQPVELQVDGRVIVNLKKTGRFDEEKDVYYSYDYETDLGLFLAALKIYRTLKLN